MNRVSAVAGLQIVMTSLCCGLVSLACAAAEDVSRFKRPEDVRGSQQAGSTPLEHSFGGLYVYSDASALRQAALAASATAPHLVVGPRPVSQFVLLSAEEEAAMWALRERQLAKLPSGVVSAFGSGALRHSSGRRHRQAGGVVTACVNAPRVVESEDKTCVPDLAHADAPDWREHLVCWVKQLRTVEVKHD